MLRSGFLAVPLLGLAVLSALAQSADPSPGAEAAQSNGLPGTPFWILVGVIAAFAILFAFRRRRESVASNIAGFPRRS
ncbi:hypothetical protein ACRAWG_37140 [Methylobacterium sp. P31]